MFDVGSHVAWSLGKDDKGEDEATGIGVVGKIEGDTAYVVEVHAFHRLWGGSNVSRGKVVEVPIAELTTCPGYWDNIIREQASKNKVRNVLDELLAPDLA